MVSIIIFILYIIHDQWSIKYIIYNQLFYQDVFIAIQYYTFVINSISMINLYKVLKLNCISLIHNIEVNYKTLFFWSTTLTCFWDGRDVY